MLVADSLGDPTDAAKGNHAELAEQVLADFALKRPARAIAIAAHLITPQVPVPAEQAEVVERRLA